MDSDLDDLLDEPHVTDDDDDLLGDAVPSAAIVDDDDDFLGGPSEPTQTKSAAPDASEPQMKSDIDMEALNIATVHETLKAFVDTKTYFAHFVEAVSHDKKERHRMVLSVTDEFILLKTPSGELVRQVKVINVIGLVLQEIMMPKKLGMVYENCLHILVKIQGQKDLIIVLLADTANDSREFSTVLGVVGTAYDLVLPVASLKQNENIYDFVHTVPVATKIRRGVAEALAYRSVLLNELKALSKEESEIEMAIAALKSSEKGHAAGDVIDEMTRLEREIVDAENKTMEATAAHEQKMEELNRVRQQLARERDHREEAVRDRLQEVAAARLIKRTAEYECMKTAHKREMDKNTAVTDLIEAFNAERTAASYNMTTVPLRLKVLEGQLDLVQGKLHTRSADQRSKVRALTENRRRTATAKDFLANLQKQNAGMSGIAPEGAVPEYLAELPQMPTIEPVTCSEATPVPLDTAKPKLEPSPSPVKLDDSPDLGVAVSGTAPKPVINLDDEVDVKPASTHADPVNLDDDDLVPVAPAAPAMDDI